LSEHVALAAQQVQLYEALEQAYNDLRQTQQAVMQQERLRAFGQMASGIAHDINNAISPMMLYTESLLENELNLSVRGRSSLETIARAVDDVAATVSRLKEFYRLREPQLQLEPVQLNDLVQQVLDLTRARWSGMPQQRGTVIQAQTDLTPNLPAILAAEGEIRDALTNLVFNAVDAMPDGGTLTMRTRVNEDRAPDGQSASRRVQVEVSDTGIGMDEETRLRCLEPFFTTKGERGTGLGLAMVYGMAERHSADAEIESEAGKGTTVRLTFSAPESIATQPAQIQPTQTVLSPQRILVVDDDPMILDSLKDALTADGHFVVAANGGQEGIETFRTAHESKESFTVVITDLGMPYIDGRQVAAALKKISPSTPVILFTGWGQRLVADGDIPPHVDRVLSKPPKLRQVREAVRSVCLP
jgi:signal transduction histidine kinase/ActR/RegA family two-component response regulator